MLREKSRSALTLNNADPLFALMITPGFYLRHEEVEDQDAAIEWQSMSIGYVYNQHSQKRCKTQESPSTVKNPLLFGAGRVVPPRVFQC